MKGQSLCHQCGKCAKPGSDVVVRYGAGGSIHKACVRPGETLVLANGGNLSSDFRSALQPQFCRRNEQSTNKPGRSVSRLRCLLNNLSS